MPDEWVNGTAQLSVNGQPFELGFTVPARPVKLRQMLPVFQRMSDTFNQIGIAGLPEGKSISCKAGCGACCRQMVPLSEAEAFDLRRVVDEMPEPRRSTITERFESGMRTLRERGFLERLSTAADKDRDEYRRLLCEYFTYAIACPFLEDESCSIHPNRPVACREYLVTSPAELCSSAEGEGIENVEYLFRVRDTLISVAREIQPAAQPFVPMIALLAWTDRRMDTSPERSGDEWMKLFLSELMDISRAAASRSVE